MTTFLGLRSGRFESSQRLKQFLGGERSVRGLAVYHPLTLGFHAFGRHSKGEELSGADRKDLAELELIAKMLFHFESDWAPSSALVRKLLLGTRSAPDLLFELNVGAFVLAPRTSGIHWRSFSPGVPDWSVAQPAFQVECKRARRGDAVVDYGQHLSKAAGQHSALGESLVIAVGFGATLDEQAMEALSKEPWRNVPWMTRHPEISGVLVMARTQRTESTFANYTVLEIRNHKAAYPLPLDFRFGDGSEVYRHTFPGPMKSLTEQV